MYDYLIVGAGLTGSIAARELTDAGKTCLIVEKRSHVGGNIYTETVDGIDVHRYGAHIFHTNDEGAWDYVNRFASFNHFINTPLANYKGELFNLPFNMNTFRQMWGVTEPQEAMEIIRRQREDAHITEPHNLEQQAISLVGTDIYEKLIKGYTEKQWGRPCNELPASIIRRLPVRFTYDNDYFGSRFQGVPVQGYTAMIEKMLSGIEVRLHTDFLADRKTFAAMAHRVIYTGCADAYFRYALGPLAYRSIRLETESLDIPDYQGNAVVNYTDRETPYTRIIEHKHFALGKQPHTVVSREYSVEWEPGVEPFYPINDDLNQSLYQKYEALMHRETNTVFLGRLGTYRYLDMDVTVRHALDFCQKELRA